MVLLSKDDGNMKRTLFLIGLITVFDAILNSRQRRLELQCLYRNSMSNNSYKTSLLMKS